MQGKASPKQSTQVVDNKQFMIYESPALPLSYPGGGGMKMHRTGIMPRFSLEARRSRRA